MMTFGEYLGGKMLYEQEKNAYEVMLDRIEMAVGNTQPYGFNSGADEAAYRAREDVLKAIRGLRSSGTVMAMPQRQPGLAARVS